MLNLPFFLLFPISAVVLSWKGYSYLGMQQATLFQLKKETSPGIDGLTSETLQVCWDFIAPTCCQLVQSFWCDGSLSKPMLLAIIKLLYKGGERVLLKN
jgi:hypothetical protein